MAIIVSEGVRADLTTASTKLQEARKAILHILDTAVMDEYERSELNKVAWLSQSWHNELESYMNNDSDEAEASPPSLTE